MDLPQPASNLRVRRALESDLEAIVDLLADDDLGRQRETPARPLAQSYREAFAEIQRDPNAELVVLEQEGEVVGTLQLNFLRGLSLQSARRAQVEAVRIKSSVRGRRLGEFLMRWAIGRARAERCQVVQLTTHLSRKDAHRFYERLGFKSTHAGMKLTL
ncbi:GNAT family acetyltransferase [Verrucomicrobia bacterium SCGC AG-212-E04]|nr:GNAT family acetyltransferase [Verrucomicrobia bacterium SCGC AG-212-E04]